MESTAANHTFHLVDLYVKVAEICDAQALIILALYAKGLVTMSSQESSEQVGSVRTVSNPAQLHHNQPELHCIRFLKTHLEHGGVSKKGYDMLYRMIEMMSAIGWEVHVMYSSKIPHVGSKGKMEWYASCILQGCDVFSNNMKATLNKAMEANQTLPELEGSREDLERKLEQWRQKLR